MYYPCIRYRFGVLYIDPGSTSPEADPVPTVLSRPVSCAHSLHVVIPSSSHFDVFYKSRCLICNSRPDNHDMN